MRSSIRAGVSRWVGVAALVACLTASGGINEHRWRNKPGEPAYASLRSSVPLPADTWLERSTPSRADGIYTYAPNDTGDEESRWFRYTDTFDPGGSTLAQLSVRDGSVRLCLKSDYMEWLPGDEPGEFMHRRAFKRCVDMTRR